MAKRKLWQIIRIINDYGCGHAGFVDSCWRSQDGWRSDVGNGGYWVDHYDSGAEKVRVPCVHTRCVSCKSPSLWFVKTRPLLSPRIKKEKAFKSSRHHICIMRSKWRC